MIRAVEELLKWPFLVNIHADGEDILWSALQYNEYVLLPEVELPDRFFLLADADVRLHIE
jgi:hypothetical protein